MRYFATCLIILASNQFLSPLNAQPELIVDKDGLTIDAGNSLEQESRELSVLRPTLAPEEIDRAVCERLLQEINQNPQSIMDSLAATEEQLTNMAITLSNARHFINNNEMANIRAMCSAWNTSALEGDARIQVALNAYKDRRQFTLDFIARYYRRVLADIQTNLNDHSNIRFDQYMEDRRRRMATAGSSYSGAVTENVRSVTESVHFHCGTPRP